MLLERWVATECGKQEAAPWNVPVHLSILQKAFEWAQYHQYDDDDEQDHEFKVEEDQDDENNRETQAYGMASVEETLWHNDYMDVDQGTIFELILAADYLDIKGLLALACKTVAYMMQWKSAEEIRAHFSLENDLTRNKINRLESILIQL